jgi:hypothetical protein
MSRPGRAQNQRCSIEVNKGIRVENERTLVSIQKRSMFLALISCAAVSRLGQPAKKSIENAFLQ